MMMKLIEILAEYSESSDESWDEERVANAISKRGLDPSLYWWADVHYSDGDYWVIFWKKTYGDFLRNIDIFDIDSDDERTLATFMDGLNGDCFWPDQAVQVMLEREEIEQHEYEDELREMRDRTESILVCENYWFDVVKGREIPYRVVHGHLSKIDYQRV